MLFEMKTQTAAAPTELLKVVQGPACIGPGEYIVYMRVRQQVVKCLQEFRGLVTVLRA